MHLNLERFQGVTYGRSPAMFVLPDLRLLQHIFAERQKAIWLRAELKRAYAELADYW